MFSQKIPLGQAIVIAMNHKQVSTMKRTFSILSLIIATGVVVALFKVKPNLQPKADDFTQTTGQCAVLSSGVGDSFNDLCFIDENNGWGITNHALWKTVDGGRHWEEIIKSSLVEGIAIPTRGVLFKVQFITSEIGWLLEQNNLLSTKDGGKTWRKYEPKDIAISSFHFLDTNKGWYVGAQIADGLHNKKFGNQPIICTTIDGGRHWDTIYRGDDAPYPLKDIYPVSSQDIWAVGASILHSEDGGKHWKTIDTIEYVGGLPIKVRFVKPDVGWVENRDAFGKYLLTTDGGKTWKVQPTTTKPSGFLDVVYTSANEAWGVDEDENGRILYRTKDGGSSWERVALGNYSFIYYLREKGLIFVAGKDFAKCQIH